MGLESLLLAPGFRFHPTDAELLVHYLIKKVKGENITNGVIGVVDIYKHEPWDLPDKAILPSRDTEWYFFSSPDRKYPRGSRTSRTTAAGFWKATGKDRKIFSGKACVGVKKTLVFYLGRVPKGSRTDWVMYEYRIDDEVEKNISNGQAFVLCRVRRKGGPGPRNGEQFGAPVVDDVQEVESPSSTSLPELSESLAPQPDYSDYVNSIVEPINTGGFSVVESLDCRDDLDDVLQSLDPAFFLHYNDVLLDVPTITENDEELVADLAREFDGGEFEVQPRQPLEPVLMAPSWGDGGDHDLIHPTLEESEMLEELLHQASGDVNDNDTVESWWGGEVYDELMGGYLEMDDLEVPIEDLGSHYENVTGEPERQEEDLASADVDGWFVPRMRQSLDFGETHTPGSVTQRVRLQVPASSVTDQERMAQATASSSTVQALDGNPDREFSAALEVSGHSSGITLCNGLDRRTENGANTSSILAGSSIGPASHTFVSKQTSASSVVSTDEQMPSHVCQAEHVRQDRNQSEGDSTTAIFEACHYEGISPRASPKTDDIDTGIGKGSVVEGTSLEFFKHVGSPDSLQLSWLHDRVEGTLAGASSPSKALSPRPLSRLLYGVLSKVPAKPAFAAELPESKLLKAVLAKHSSAVLPLSDVALPECPQLEADHSLRVSSVISNTFSSLSVSTLRAKPQNASVLPFQGPTLSSSTTVKNTCAWTHPGSKACKAQSRGLRVLFRVATTVLIFACLLQGVGRLTMSALTIF